MHSKFEAEKNYGAENNQKRKKGKILVPIRLTNIAAVILTGGLLMGGLTTLLVGCSEEKPKPVSKTIFALGTTCTVKLYNADHEEKIETVFELIREVDNKMSVQKEGTEARRINEAAGKNPVKVSEKTYTVVKKAKEYSALSNGAFDLTVEPLVAAWSIGSEEQKIPSDKEIESALEKIDYRKVQLNKEERSVFLEEEGMGLDLGGIAKGYAADISVDYLEEHGVEYGIINFGGNVYSFGKKHEDNRWRVGIQSPGKERGSYVGIVELVDKAVVTSGEYERYFMKDGTRYHHILSTEDGFPVRNALSSVTVVTERALDADALSTYLFTLGLEEGMRKAKELENVEAIFLTEEKIAYTTDGLRETFRLSSDEYKRGEAKSIVQTAGSGNSTGSENSE